ncbi:hypothetical protein [Lyngbya sp. PCC 8106]|uniref:hypothetical protein n=1 Tax=Lyngbya sp. (strain PCC 8106) TaxID=313612 RepID=UPI0000EAA9DF|nr:hypothetical protein [Lyngbya sp. PCC 8106]EAW37427.1 hypothetical protein L8106_00330 [Lyngbya sp. PCC 8106]
MVNYNSNSNESQTLAIQALYSLLKAETHLLKALREAAKNSSEIEVNSVLQIIEEVLKTQQAESKKIAEFCENRKKALILAQIEKEGINISSPGLKILIQDANFQNLKDALLEYKEYSSNKKVWNPEGLFYYYLKQKIIYAEVKKAGINLTSDIQDLINNKEVKYSRLKEALSEYKQYSKSHQVNDSADLFYRIVTKKNQGGAALA